MSPEWLKAKIAEATERRDRKPYIADPQAWQYWDGQVSAYGHVLWQLGKEALCGM